MNQSKKEQYDQEYLELKKRVNERYPNQWLLSSGPKPRKFIQSPKTVRKMGGFDDKPRGLNDPENFKNYFAKVGPNYSPDEVIENEEYDQSQRFKQNDFEEIIRRIAEGEQRERDKNDLEQKQQKSSYPEYRKADIETIGRIKDCDFRMEIECRPFQTIPDQDDEPEIQEQVEQKGSLSKDKRKEKDSSHVMIHKQKKSSNKKRKRSVENEATINLTVKNRPTDVKRKKIVRFTPQEEENFGKWSNTDFETLKSEKNTSKSDE